MFKLSARLPVRALLASAAAARQMHSRLLRAPARSAIAAPRDRLFGPSDAFTPILALHSLPTVRYASSGTDRPATDATALLASPSALPDGAAPLTDLADASASTPVSALSEVLTPVVPYIGEVSAHGLGSWVTPVGLVENLTELATVSCGGSWVAGIAAVTVGFRLTVLPLVLKGMRNNYTMNNIRPEIMQIQEQAKALELAGDDKGAHMTKMKMVELFRKHDVNPFRALIPLVVQMPLFISFFLALRSMASTPLESMMTGGALWFPNLTAADPYYVLPVVASGFMLATVELGSDGMQQQPHMKKFFRFLSVFMLPFTIDFQSAIFVYWISSNAFSLGQLMLSRTKAVRRYFGIPDLIVHPPSDTKPFMAQMKEVYQNAQQKAAHEQQIRDAEKRLETLRGMKIPRAPKQEKTPAQK
eukprot:m.692998 g.692998  ORF g.692998 m.692998 type:complete len:417 (-) comp58653_c0_seq5:90-1340(-)